MSKNFFARSCRVPPSGKKNFGKKGRFLCLKKAQRQPPFSKGEIDWLSRMGGAEAEVGRIEMFILNPEEERKEIFVKVFRKLLKKLLYWKRHPNPVMRRICQDHNFLRLLVVDEERAVLQGIIESDFHDHKKYWLKEFVEKIIKMKFNGGVGMKKSEIIEKLKSIIKAGGGCVVFITEDKWTFLEEGQFEIDQYPFSEKFSVLGIPVLSKYKNVFLGNEIHAVYDEKEALEKFQEMWMNLKNNWRDRCCKDDFGMACGYSHICRFIAEIMMKTGRKAEDIFKIFEKRYDNPEKPFTLDNIYKEMERGAFLQVVEGKIEP